MNTVAKSALGITAAGGIGGAAYGTYDYQTATLEYLINLKFPVPINFVNEGENKESQLKALVDSYIASASSTAREISGLVLTNNDEANRKKLFDKCIELRSTKISFMSEDDRKELGMRTLDWCVVIEDVGDALKREWKSVLETFDSEFEIHKSKSDFKTFLSKDSTATLEKTVDLPIYENKCKALLEKKVTNESYITDLKNARKYCARSA